MKTLLLNSIRIAAFAIGTLLISTSICIANSGNKPSVELNKISAETELSLENWMTDLSAWSNSYIIEDSEEEMEIEEWMLNSDNWATLSEEEIELESWMNDLEKW